ncbi:ribosome small subunit-dependent GTPase A [Paenibacillus alkalitolerans]|uniref:ribosome small subunit-dependent GTPase A n=1 Tax=Paenibacillus alkalitolerans TaxID=2799335 RepID=UPI001F1C1659|nr:ribosome small subunit-dependent GTPase A [Paenibacillus alkalitolerans]
MTLVKYGWNETWERQFEPFRDKGLEPGRVVLEHKRMYRVITQHGELLSELSGKLRYEAEEREQLPAVGDWVAVAARPAEGRATIHALLPRKSKFSRKSAGVETTEQIVAANVDTVFLVNAMNQDFNMRRLERYLVLAWESGANPVIVLSKADLCDDVDAMIAQAESIGMGVPVHAVSVEAQSGIDELLPYVSAGNTVALLGSSGVGKSSLVNTLLGVEAQKVSGIREADGRGRHTTTHRELLTVPGGGIVVDTPGMREIQMWEASEGLSESFEDIESLAGRCQFADCSHNREPNCAVRKAVEAGELEEGRLANYRKLLSELAYLARKEEAKVKLQEKKSNKKKSQHSTTIKHRSHEVNL